MQTVYLQSTNFVSSNTNLNVLYNPGQKIEQKKSLRHTQNKKKCVSVEYDLTLTLIWTMDFNLDDGS